MTGIPSLVASFTAIFSYPTSITNRASGIPFISFIPDKLTSSFSNSRTYINCSFLLICSKLPSVCIASISFKRFIEPRTVLKLVSNPPNQRRFTYGISQRFASSETIVCADCLVPTNKIVFFFDANLLIKLTASL